LLDRKIDQLPESARRFINQLNKIAPSEQAMPKSLNRKTAELEIED